LELTLDGQMAKPTRSGRQVVPPAAFDFFKTGGSIGVGRQRAPLAFATEAFFGFAWPLKFQTPCIGLPKKVCIQG
jgi:hypothetical protein